MDFTLTLVRHGESEANIRHMLSGWMDVNLTEHGIAELKELRTCVDYPESDVYYSSPLKRCVETAGILFPGVSPIISDSFKEIDFHSLEGTILPTRSDIDAYFNLWIKDVQRRDEETMSSVMARGSKALVDTVKSLEECGKQSATIVMHSGLMRASIVSLFSLDRTEFLRMNVPNGLGYVLIFDNMQPVSFHELQRRSDFR